MKIPHLNLRTKEPRVSSAGFTLLELLMASAAFAMIVLVMKVTLMGSLSMRNRSQERMDALNTRMRVMEIMEKDLRQCALKETALAQEFIGETLSGGVERSDQLTLYTASGVVQTNLPWGHLQKVRYYLQQPMTELREQTQSGWALYREVTRNLVPANGLETLMMPQALVSSVHSLAFQYYDGQYWKDNWDSSTDDPKLPLAVRIRITFLPAGEEALSSGLNDERQYPVLETIVPLISTAQVEEAAEEDGETTQGDADTGQAANAGGR